MRNLHKNEKIRFTLYIVSSLFMPIISVADEISPPTQGTSLFQISLGLVVVIGFVVFMGWMVKKFNLQPLQSQAVAKIVGGVSVGQREKVIVVEIADQWIIVGVAPGRVNGLATIEKNTEIYPNEPLPKNTSFKQWLNNVSKVNHPN